MPARRERIIAKKRRQPAFPAQHDARRGHRYPPSPVTSRDDHQARYLTFAASRSIGRNDGLPRRMVRTHEQLAGPHHIGGPSRGLCLSGHDLCSCLLGTGRDARLSAGFTVTGGLAGHHTGSPRRATERATGLRRAGAPEQLSSANARADRGTPAGVPRACSGVKGVTDRSAPVPSTGKGAAWRSLGPAAGGDCCPRGASPDPGGCRRARGDRPRAWPGGPSPAGLGVAGHGRDGRARLIVG